MTQTETASMKTAFTRQKEDRVDKVMDEAQRLVNLYRHADAFGEGFQKKLDEMLKKISPEVQAAFSDILGGAVVRQYYDFLMGNKADTSPDDALAEEPAPPAQQGYLPPPDEDDIDTPAPMGGDSTALKSLVKNMIQAHQSELERLLQAQTETLSQVLQRLDKNTHDIASRQTDRLIHAMRQESGNTYSDVIEETPTPVLVPDETEGF